MSLLELEEAEKQLQEDMELDVDEDDEEDDFEKVDKLRLPLVSKWNYPDGTPIEGLEVPAMKEDDFILDSMYRDDIVYGPTTEDPPPPPHVFDPLPPPPAPVCSICFKHWTILHHFWYLSIYPFTTHSLFIYYMSFCLSPCFMAFYNRFYLMRFMGH